MKKIILLILSMALFFGDYAYANQETPNVSLNASVQEVQQATLDDNENDKPKKKKTTKKTKKNKKAKKS